MGKNKIKRFAENMTFENLVQPDFDGIFHRDHVLKGRWGDDFFGNNHPIVLELGCGRGEYTVGLGAAFPGRNFIGIDIKGARMWRGAKTATEMGMPNVGFLRTRIEFINSFFAPGEVSGIWITFPDPQLKKGREKKRLTSPVFLTYYARFLAADGLIHLKTDSRELHEYTRRVIAENNLPCEVVDNDIYNNYESGTDAAEREQRLLAGSAEPQGGKVRVAELITNYELTSIKTAYERRFLEEGKPITYLRFGLAGRRDFDMICDEE